MRPGDTADLLIAVRVPEQQFMHKALDIFVERFKKDLEAYGFEVLVARVTAMDNTVVK